MSILVYVYSHPLAATLKRTLKEMAREHPRDFLEYCKDRGIDLDIRSPIDHEHQDIEMLDLAAFLLM